MNNNILSPKGKIDQSLFIIYYILLTVVYIAGGLFLLIYIYKNNLPSLYFIWPLLIIKLLIAFNYKKRLMDISNNIWLSVILGFVLTFDTECLVACKLIKDLHASMITFFVLGIFILFIQPAIIALIPGKDNTPKQIENNETNQE